MKDTSSRCSSVPSPLAVVLMGVSGSGKTTLGLLLARRTGAIFVDADDYHSSANKAKMSAGTALTDEDRQPWLETLNMVLRGWVATQQPGILACSALKQKYRETLTASIPEAAVQFILLDGSKEMIGERLRERHHEYMTGALLESQLSTLERPDNAVRVVNDRSPDRVVDEILSKLQMRECDGKQVV